MLYSKFYSNVLRLAHVRKTSSYGIVDDPTCLIIEDLLAAPLLLSGETEARRTMPYWEWA